jgi:hypothetical protein
LKRSAIHDLGVQATGRSKRKHHGVPRVLCKRGRYFLHWSSEIRGDGHIDFGGIGLDCNTARKCDLYYYLAHNNPAIHNCRSEYNNSGMPCEQQLVKRPGVNLVDTSKPQE